MALAITRENFFWHKVHSLTGIIPVGFYMVQHLTLNSFSLTSAAKFNSVGQWFEALPKHLFLLLEIGAIWLPLLFHSIYGIFITNRGQQNLLTTKYRWSQNRMYTMQRWSGIFIFFYLAYHVATTTAYRMWLEWRGVPDAHRVVEYAAWHAKLTSFGGLFLVIYMLGILACSYHLAYGIWNFCIRWGITITERAQHRIQKFSLAAFVGITLLGWGALYGFVFPRNPGDVQAEPIQAATTVSPTTVSNPVP